MSNNTLDRSNEPQDEPVDELLDTELDSPIGETEDVGSPTEEESSPTVDLDEL